MVDITASPLGLGVLSLLIGSINAQAPIVDLGYARYQGAQNLTTGINSYNGIRFAQSPTGPLRWRAPQPIEASSDLSNKTVNATQVGPACYQSLPLWFKLDGGPAAAAAVATPQGQSEDCLNLNVLVPVKPTAAALPVVVQIHSGGYTSGNGKYISPGEAIVNASSGKIIHVSIQYRLGVFGFLAGDQIAADGVLNAGVLDQRLALDWVQNHISAFGGDPSKVTVWGASAGGGSITHHLISKGGSGSIPFRAAIIEYPWWQPLLNTTLQNRQYQTTLAVSKCTSLSCLRSLPSETLATVNQAVQNASYPSPGIGYGLYYFGPVVDGSYIQDLPSREFLAGHFHRVPLLTDREGSEGFVFSNASITTQEEETADARYLFPSATQSFFSRLYQLYPASSFSSVFLQRAAWFGDFIINCPTWQTASAMSKVYSGGTSAVSSPSTTTTPSVPVYKLLFNAGSQIHTATIPFLSSLTPGFPEADNQTLAQIMAGYWISFVVDNNPNTVPGSVGRPKWPSYVAASGHARRSETGGNGGSSGGHGARNYTILDIEPSYIRVIGDPDASDRCEFFREQGPVIRNK